MDSWNPILVRMSLKLAIIISFIASVYYPYKIYSFCGWQSETGWFSEDKIVFFLIIAYFVASAAATAVKKDQLFCLLDFICFAMYFLYALGYLAITSFFGGQPPSVAWEKVTRGLGAYLTNDNCRIREVVELGEGFYPFWLIGVFLLLLALYNYKTLVRPPVSDD
jgi:hypothetical protein